MGLKWLVFLIRPLYLIGMWLGEDQRANIIKTTFLKEIGLRLQNINNYSTLNSEHNFGGLVYPFKKSTNMHFDNHNWIKDALIFKPTFANVSS